MKPKKPANAMRRTGDKLMDALMMGSCGAYCGACEWKDRTDCPGCQNVRGRPFWGECAIAQCAIGRGVPHCGSCENLPCERLRSAFAHPEHGDGGERLDNLKSWARGETTFLKLRSQK
jgi:hypothetical protein